MLNSPLTTVNDFQGDIGLRATQMLTELVKDNQKIVDRVTEADIQTMVTLVKRKRVSYYNTI